MFNAECKYYHLAMCEGIKIPWEAHLTKNTVDDVKCSSSKKLIQKTQPTTFYIGKFFFLKKKTIIWESRVEAGIFPP